MSNEQLLIVLSVFGQCFVGGTLISKGIRTYGILIIVFSLLPLIVLRLV